MIKRECINICTLFCILAYSWYYTIAMLEEVSFTQQVLDKKFILIK